MVQCFYWPEKAMEWPEPVQCDMQGNRNLIGSYLSGLSVYFLFLTFVLLLLAPNVDMGGGVKTNYIGTFVVLK